MLITRERLKAFAPKAAPAIVEAFIAGAGEIERAGITSPMRAVHFLAQAATETGGLTKLTESLNYSVAGLRATFGKHRISDADVKRLGRAPGRPAKQEEIANIIYGGAWGRKNLGNTEPGDGWRYRGSGILQTTGRANFRRAGREDDPEALRTPGPALTSALKFWTDHSLNALADRDEMTKIRKVINGGTNGLDECLVWLGKAKRAFR